MFRGIEYGAVLPFICMLVTFSAPALIWVFGPIFFELGEWLARRKQK